MVMEPCIDMWKKNCFPSANEILHIPEQTTAGVRSGILSLL